MPKKVMMPGGPRRGGDPAPRDAFDLQKDREDAARRAREGFDVRVEPFDHPIENGEIAVRTTRNGYQWQVLRLTPFERDKVIEVLMENARQQHEKESDG